jgi:WD40 repeat protein
MNNISRNRRLELQKLFCLVILVYGIFSLELIAEARSRTAETTLTAPKGTTKSNTAKQIKLRQVLQVNDALAVTALAWSPDSKLLAVNAAKNAIQLWDSASLTLTRTISTNSPEGYISGLDWSPDGKSLASARFRDERELKGNEPDDYVVVWDINTGEALQVFSTLDSPAFCTAWSPDGHFLAAGTSWGQIYAWDFRTREVVARMELLGSDTGYYESIFWSPDGKYLVSSTPDRWVRVWQVSSHTQVHELAVSDLNGILAVAWSPNGAQIIAGRRDGSIVLLDTKTWKKSRILDGHVNEVKSLAWSPDSTLFASTGLDRSILLWDATTGKIQQQLVKIGQPRMRVLRWSPDGTMIATGGEDGTLWLWDVVDS